MDIILIPGLRLDDSSWEQLVPALERDGHRVHPVTLPGKESPQTDQVEAVVAAIDAIGRASGKAVLVGDSGGSSVAEAAVEPRIDEHGRPEPVLAGSELATLLGFLDYQRATFAWKCRGLGAAGLQATVGASTMTLGGMLKHMAVVEEGWFSRSLFGRDYGPPWNTVDWEADRDWEWHTAAEDSPEQLFTLWEDAVNRSRALVTEVLSAGGLDQLARRTWPDGSAPSLRWILCHMIEEYARHNGHADLIRESIDGMTGE